MEYSNPELPEGINTSQTNHLKEFLVLSTGVIGIIIIVIVTLIFIVDNFADKIPFSAEKELPLDVFFNKKSTDKLPPYLKQVSEKVIASFDLPDDMDITIHYVNDDTVNAYATLGGHIVLYRGLLEKLKHEDELAMLIAHEVAHVKHRHPILSVSHGLVVGVVMILVSSSVGTSVVSDLLGQTSMLTLMQYSREFEYQSDKEATQSLIRLYGHAKGSVGLFEILQSEASGNQSLEFLSTHPLTENRIKQAESSHQGSNALKVNVAYTPLPNEFLKWLLLQKEEAKKNKNNKKMTP